MSPLDVAIKAALESGKLIKESSGQLHSQQISVKQKFDYVTQIDLESEKKIVDTILHYFPDHSIMAEESGSMTSKSSYQWIIDPLDGTTNFIHNYPVCAVSIALEFEKEIILGVVYNPFLDELFHAEKGKGSYLNNQQVNVSKERDLSKCLLTTGFPFKYKNLLDSYLEIFSAIFLQVSGIRRTGSAALDLAYVACGRVDGFWEFKLSPWDIAAGDILIREAGGWITDVEGENHHISTGNVIATNSFIHTKILQEINKVFTMNP